ncbi:hypothetical protein N8772_01370 [Rickettsiales bacterium]|nr:hypothetical protein [Rickettsiales bacterium]
MLQIKYFLVFLLLLTLSSCLSIRNFDSYQKVPLSESEFLPTKGELKGEIKKIVVFPFDADGNEVAKNANISKVAIASIENILTENKLIKLIDRNSAKKLEKEIRLSEMKKSGIYKGPQIANYAIMGSFSNASFTSKYKAATPGYKPNEGVYLKPAGFEYNSNIAGNVKIYELPSLSVIENIAFEGKAFRTEGSKEEGTDIMGIINIKGKRDQGAKRDDNLVRQATKKSIESISRKLKNIFAKKGYILEKRIHDKKAIFKISLGRKDGIKKGNKFDIIGKFEEENAITGDSEIENHILAKGKVSDKINDKSSWILIDKDDYNKVRLGDIIRIKY